MAFPTCGSPARWRSASPIAADETSLPAPPGVGDLDGDGQLELVLQSFDHGVDIFEVPGSGTKCLVWPTGRGNLLRNGQGPAYK